MKGYKPISHKGGCVSRALSTLKATNANISMVKHDLSSSFLRVPVQVLALNKIFWKENHAMHPSPETRGLDICVDEQHDTNV